MAHGSWLMVNSFSRPLYLLTSPLPQSLQSLASRPSRLSHPPLSSFPLPFFSSSSLPLTLPHSPPSLPKLGSSPPHPLSLSVCVCGLVPRSTDTISGRCCIEARPRLSRLSSLPSQTPHPQARLPRSSFLPLSNDKSRHPSRNKLKKAIFLIGPYAVPLSLWSFCPGLIPICSVILSASATFRASLRRSLRHRPEFPPQICG